MRNRRADVVDPLGGKEADWDMTKITKRTGIRIYRMKDAPELKGSDFVDDLEYANSELRDVFSLLSSASASLSRVLVRQPPDEGGFSVLYLFFKANYPLLRHRHGSDCLYVIVSGSAVMGRQTLNVGDSFFVPANAPYSYTAGPEGVEVLEIRHDVESVSTSYIGDPPGRLEQAQEAVRTNTTAWNDVETGPLLQANSAALS
jgi:mannose-6-phosphate isomerase-like protein (cupin superfamily)